MYPHYSFFGSENQYLVSEENFYNFIKDLPRNNPAKTKAFIYFPTLHLKILQDINDYLGANDYLLSITIRTDKREYHLPHLGFKHEATVHKVFLEAISEKLVANCQLLSFMPTIEEEQDIFVFDAN